MLPYGKRCGARDVRRSSPTIGGECAIHLTKNPDALFTSFYFYGIIESTDKLEFDKGLKYMDKETIGTVLSLAKQWWLKVNTKLVRMGTMDGATFPHIIKVQYVVDGNTYAKRKWIGAGKPVPAVGSKVTVLYCSEKPSKAKIL